MSFNDHNVHKIKSDENNEVPYLSVKVRRGADVILDSAAKRDAVPKTSSTAHPFRFTENPTQ